VQGDDLAIAPDVLAFQHHLPSAANGEQAQPRIEDRHIDQ
jgi:hypothetical protein